MTAASSVKQPLLDYRGVLEEVLDDAQPLQRVQHRGYLALAVQPSLGCEVDVTPSFCSSLGPDNSTMFAPPCSSSRSTHCATHMSVLWCLPSFSRQANFPVTCSNKLLCLHFAKKIKELNAVLWKRTFMPAITIVIYVIYFPPHYPFSIAGMN